jgi:transcriptional regulator with PAS, ATPase and Fis domain
VSDSESEQELTTLLARQSPIATVTSERCTLLVVSGPDDGHSFHIGDLATRRVFVGQSPACEVRLRDPLASRRHAALELVSNALHVRDLESTNGTWINRVRVIEALLQSGDHLQVGGTLLRVELDGTPHVLPASTDTRFHKVMGVSPEMRRLYPVFERVAKTHIPVLIEGETGTGKEVLAESLHAASPRADGPFVVVDCTTIAPNLLEAELFGYERGAFTGAIAARDGLFLEANGGTLFLDEIGDIDLPLQAKLLRAIEKGEVRRIGSNRWSSVDIRIIAATRRDLDREVQAGRFRDDLFFRLAVARVELPPLRRRRGDVTFLAALFWSTLGGDERGIPQDVLQRYEARDWPGNVRELYNAVAQQMALGDDASVLRAGDSRVASTAIPDLSACVGAAIAEGKNIALARQAIVDAFDRAYTDRMLEMNDGNVTRAAAASGIGRRYFQMLRARK